MTAINGGFAVGVPFLTSTESDTCRALLLLLSRIPGVVSVTNNSTRVRIGYRIYALWRFTPSTQVTVTVNTIALSASQIPLSELYCADVSLRGLTAEN
jgi:hypothetical protein